MPKIEHITDIKISKNRYIYLKINGRYEISPKFIEASYFNMILAKLTGGLYAHEDTIVKGYFTDIYGNRCGVSGRAVNECGAVKSICDIDTVIIRLAPFYRHSADMIFEQSEQGRESLLLYGAPASGKTTLLRDLAYSLSCEPLHMNVSVIDTKNEFRSSDYPPGANITILKGYPFLQGADIAIKNLSSDIIICDEIPLYGHLDIIANIAVSGVSLYASVHSSRHGLEKKSYYSALKEINIFDDYIYVEKGALSLCS